MTTDSTTPTTDTTPASAPAAPATSSTSSVPESRSTTPAATWDEAFDRGREAAGASDPGDEHDTADPSASTTPTPAPVETAPVPEETPAPAGKGPIPFERHEAILKNARVKAQHEVVQRVEQVFGPAITLQRSLQSNPIGTLTQLIDEAMADPELGPQIVSHAARTLSQRRGRPPVESEEPQPDLETSDGTPVYSAGQQAKREHWLRAQILQEVAKQTAPLAQEAKARKEEQVLGAHRAQIRETVTSRLSQWRERPGFKDHEAAIAEAQDAYVQQGLDPWSAMGLAYTDVVVPHLRADTQTTLVKAAVAKAKASTTSQATTAPAPVRGIAKTWDEAMQMAGFPQ